jgi:hypothetical protein
MGFLLDAPFPAIGYYTSLPEVMVSSITPSTPDGPTILVQISGAGTFGGSVERSSTDFANNLIHTPFENPYRLTLPLAYRRKFIISDRQSINPFDEPFTAKDENDREYTAVGRKRSRYIIFKGASVVENPFVTGGSVVLLNQFGTNSVHVLNEPNGKITTVDDRTIIKDGFMEERLTIEDWTSVRNIVYTDGLP